MEWTALMRPRAIGFVNNYISYSLLLADLEAKSIPTTETVLIAVRELEPDRPFLCFHPYPGMPQDSILENLRFVSYYRSASRLIRKALKSSALEQISVVNQDNIISNHLLNSVSRARKNILCEGLLNFNSVETTQHGVWRDWVRPLLASLIGLRYQKPIGHLSGSQRSDVSSVVTFSPDGIVAPPNKVVTRNFLSTQKNSQPADPKAALIIATSLCRLMPEAEYQLFAKRYASWILSQGFQKIYLKRHPRSDDPFLESLLPDIQLYGEGVPVEELASELPAQTIIGPGTTPLVTLKLLRPDLRCVDVGADLYAPILYDSGSNMVELFDVAGVECVQLEAKPAPNKGNEWSKR